MEQSPDHVLAEEGDEVRGDAALQVQRSIVLETSALPASRIVPPSTNTRMAVRWRGGWVTTIGFVGGANQPEPQWISGTSPRSFCLYSGSHR
jgi:hypothetical protein